MILFVGVVIYIWIYQYVNIMFSLYFIYLGVNIYSNQSLENPHLVIHSSENSTHELYKI